MHTRLEPTAKCAQKKELTSNISLVDMLPKEWCFVRRSAGSWAALGDAPGLSRSSQVQVFTFSGISENQAFSSRSSPHRSFMSSSRGCTFVFAVFLVARAYADLLKIK